jgi:hypothetical protein
VRRVLLLVGSIVFVDTLFFAALTPLLPHYADELDLGKAGAGVLAAANPAGCFFGAIPSGIVAARFGVKPTVLVGMSCVGQASGQCYGQADRCGSEPAMRPWFGSVPRHLLVLPTTNDSVSIDDSMSRFKVASFQIRPSMLRYGYSVSPLTRRNTGSVVDQRYSSLGKVRPCAARGLQDSACRWRRSCLRHHSSVVDLKLDQRSTDGCDLR